MALTGRGGQFGGPRYGWGEVPDNPGAGVRSGSAGSRTNFNSGLGYTASPEAGLRRGEWQWRGHGPSAQRDYGWDYQGGVGRDEITLRTEARGGGSYLSRMAQDRSGGLPRYHDDYDAGDRWFSRLGEGRYAGDYDRGDQGRMGGYGRGGYDRGYGGMGGGGRHGMDYGASYRGRGGYGGDYRGMDRGGPRALSYGSGEGRGGYDRDHGTPPRLSDEEFYRRVERW
ncbi:MAG TPA: hypothetical protein VHG08_05350 [Longimicrobium sp.]|nr:hypothetical protein [Longimicrobium sp.]